MKKIICTLATIATLATSAIAVEPNVATGKASQQQEKQLLSPVLEDLFMKDRLAEVVVKPTYSAAEQIIFREQVRQLKQQVDRNTKKGK